MKDYKEAVERALKRILVSLWAMIEKAIVNYAFKALVAGAQWIAAKALEIFAKTRKPAIA